jgi:hypothetical protein
MYVLYLEGDISCTTQRAAYMRDDLLHNGDIFWRMTKHSLADTSPVRDIPSQNEARDGFQDAGGSEWVKQRSVAVGFVADFPDDAELAVDLQRLPVKFDALFFRPVITERSEARFWETSPPQC